MEHWWRRFPRGRHRTGVPKVELLNGRRLGEKTPARHGQRRSLSATSPRTSSMSLVEMDGFEQAGHCRWREGISTKLGSHLREPKATAIAFEAGVSGQEDATLVPGVAVTSISRRLPGTPQPPPDTGLSPKYRMAAVIRDEKYAWRFPSWARRSIGCCST